MKIKKFIIVFITVLIISSMNICYAASFKGKFTEKDVSGTNFKEITITPYNTKDDEDDEERDYYIYLPTGYFVEGDSASYVADRNGSYPFTVYDGTNKKTFVYKVDDIEDPVEDEKDNVYADYKLMYDYEKKQIFLNLKTDKQRKITTPNGMTITNEINYYISNATNNSIVDFSITIDEVPFNYKVVKSGEYYLLIYISPVNYSDYSTIVEYSGYNFTNSLVYTTYPAKDIYEDNGNHTVLIKSDNDQQVFNINISGIDYRRPSVEAELNNDNIELKIEDDYELDYIITFDGKYVDIASKEAEYKSPIEIIYRGDYIFTVVDKKGNRTVENVVIESKSKRKITTSKRRHTIELDVHDSKYTDELFESKGLKYTKPNDDDNKSFENILPSYMNGKNTEVFSPDSSITRAEMVTIFCRLNDLPYDNSAHLKSKFTDISEHWAKDYISMGSNKKYVSGYKDKTFKPDNLVTRAEFCQMLTKISAYKSLLNTIPASSNNNYIDINKHWAEKDIIKIANKNLVLSESDYFRPDEPITRAEVVYAINNLYGFNPSYLELAYTNSLYNRYYNFKDIGNHKYYDHIIISLVGMYREVVD